MLVKAWLGSDPQQDQQKARVVLSWLERVAQLGQLSPDYMPKIHEFGIAKKSGCLFTVSDFIDGKVGEIWIFPTRKTDTYPKLISHIEHLHGLGFTHGDLKPENLLISRNQNDDELQIYILDVLDFSPTGHQFNTAYSPEFDHVTEKQRDNFAVMKMACELLGMTWNEPSEDYPEITDTIAQEYSDPVTAFISLSRFKDALNPKAITPMVNITVGGSDSFSPIDIYPDNGELFVQFEKSKQDDVLVKFIGFGGFLEVFYSVQERAFTHALAPVERTHIRKKDRDNSVISVPFGLSVVHGSYSEVSELNKILKNNDLFRQAINQFISKEIETSVNEIDDGSEYIETQAKTIRPNIHDLWQAILDTETEALPSLLPVMD